MTKLAVTQMSHLATLTLHAPGAKVLLSNQSATLLTQLRPFQLQSSPAAN
jgi:hypothetical protein